jgi:hypothetical protein
VTNGRVRTVAWFFAYFAVTLCIGCFVRDVPDQSPLFETADAYIKTHPTYSDPVSFLYGAVDVAAHGWFTPPSYWLIHLWPPGFMVFEGLILRLFGHEAPFVLIIVVACALLCAAVLTRFRSYFLRIAPIEALSLLPLAPFLIPLVRLTLLEPADAVYGEGLAILLFLLGQALMLSAALDRSARKAILAGIAIGAAAYVRTQFEPLIQIATVLAVVGLAIALLGRRRFGLDRIVPVAILTVVIAFGAQLTLAPWKLHNVSELGHYQWVYMLYDSTALTDRQLKAFGGVENGTNIACKLEPAYCGHPNALEYYQVFVTHFPSWIAFKSRLIGPFWFPSVSFSKDKGDPAGWFFDALLLAFAIALVPLLWVMRGRPDGLAQLWLTASVAGFFVVLFALIHFEPRYFYLMKIFAAFTFVELAVPLAVLRFSPAAHGKQRSAYGERHAGAD